MIVKLLITIAMVTFLNPITQHGLLMKDQDTLMIMVQLIVIIEDQLLIDMVMKVGTHWTALILRIVTAKSVL